jgi:hypothetical protein
MTNNLNINKENEERVANSLLKTIHFIATKEKAHEEIDELHLVFQDLFNLYSQLSGKSII